MSDEQNTVGRLGPKVASVDSSKHIALYVQLANIFRFNIRSGSWPAGFKMPNFEELADQFKVSRVTVRQAVALLVSENLLTSSRGRGTTVLPMKTSNVSNSRPSIFPAESSTSKIDIRVLHQTETTTLPEEFRAEFSCYDRYVEIAKIHLQKRQPFAMMRIFVPLVIFQRFPARAAKNARLFNLCMAHREAGEEGKFLEQTTTVEPADYVLSERLNYAFGSPVAKITRRLVDQSNRLIYTGVSWYRGDQFVMKMVLPRAVIEEMPFSLLLPSYQTSN